ncbi:MAG: proton-conducting transporter membrane subunit [Candidatus Scalindua sp.]
MYLIVFQLLFVLTFGIFFLSKRHMSYFGLFIQLGLAGITGYWSVDVLIHGTSFERELLINFWGRPLGIKVDSLSAFFILILNFTMLTGTMYSTGYLRPYINKKNNVEFGLHYFSLVWLHISMILVCMVRDGLAFLVIWELMSVSSFYLVIFESEKEETVKAGIYYLLEMHVGLVLIMIGFIYAFVQTGSGFSFGGLTVYFARFHPFPLFLLFFAGFGIKAGFIPLHTWLPRAHPAAPSHVSGVMSGVMIKMGIYGILRVLTYIHTDLFAIGVFILIVSSVSGLLGVMYAIVQHDLKKLLAYHSIENIGIIGIGIGIGLIGIAKDIPVLTALGFTGGILHILNHSLFKSLLFYSAGSVYMRTHTKHIEHLGGLIKRMPVTALLFLLGALAICGLPPFNGFISEFLIYSGLFKGLSTANFQTDFTILGTVICLALIGGLAIFCFTKVFSIVFLGAERSMLPENVKEVNGGMIFPQILAVIMIVAIGVFPLFFVKAAGKVVELYAEDITSILQNTPSLSGVSRASLVFMLLTALLWFLRRTQQKRVPIERGPTWGCAYSGADPAVHQYTATSFADNYRVLSPPVIKVDKHFESLKEEEIFPPPKSFKTETGDLLEENLVERPVRKIIHWMERSAIFQTGNLQHYIMYAFLFMGLIFLLTMFKLI